ncbi:MAG: septum site-determining protein MinC [Nitrosomonas sp.]|nr:septum site-determining protein MinC [Nitrosomonas sp.]MDP1950846.1 septum site-determining protein MinC [Nitrosomonas sp.]
MSIDPQRTPNTLPILEFKSSSTLFVPILILYSNDLHNVEQSLYEKINQAPDFFRNSPLVFDVQELNKRAQDLDITVLASLLRRIGLFPIGIRGGSEQQNKQAEELFIAIDAIRSSDSSSVPAETPKPAVIIPDASPTSAAVKPTAIPLPAAIPTTIISHPIRSGQRIYAKGDLIILSQVSAGAEIMAEGNIHVYNTLRGRALAGVQGNKDARIFCFDLQAELISIAGDYKTSEDLDKSLRKKPVQIYLQDRALIIKDIA